MKNDQESIEDVWIVFVEVFCCYKNEQLYDEYLEYLESIMNDTDTLNMHVYTSTYIIIAKNG